MFYGYRDIKMREMQLLKLRSHEGKQYRLMGLVEDLVYIYIDIGHAKITNNKTGDIHVSFGVKQLILIFFMILHNAI